MGPTVAIIPARGGSERVPRKNAAMLAGMPLLSISIRHALRSRSIDAVYVSTEDDTLAKLALESGAEVIRRPMDLAGGQVSSEAVLEHSLQWLREQGQDPELVVLLQCTSPVRGDGDIDGAIETLLAASADSLLSVTPNPCFLWNLAEDGQPTPLNYDPERRPRSQERRGQYQENGSIYVFRPWVLDKLRSRLGGRIALYPMDFWSSFEIDTPEDLELCRWILRTARSSARPPLPDVPRLLVLDFDGVLTDDRVALDEHGNEAVVCSRSDGMGIALVRARGVRVVVVSSEVNPVVSMRCRKLEIACFQGVRDKRAKVEAILSDERLCAADLIYVGNDVNDLDCIELAGCGIAVADAHPVILDAADWVLARRGGRGAVRELCDLILARLDLVEEVG